MLEFFYRTFSIGISEHSNPFKLVLQKYGDKNNKINMVTIFGSQFSINLKFDKNEVR